jgi:hypothetical protein
MTIYDHMMSYGHYHTPYCHTLYGVWLESLVNSRLGYLLLTIVTIIITIPLFATEQIQQ